MRRYAAGVLVVLALAAATFVSRRNAEYEARALAEARAAGGEVVSAPRRSERYSFLKRRFIGARQLGGSSGLPDDKLLADAATQAEREGGSARFLEDGRIVATRKVEGGTAVAIVRPSLPPAGIPWGIVVLLVVGGGAIAIAAPRALSRALPRRWRGRGGSSGFARRGAEPPDRPGIYHVGLTLGLLLPAVAARSLPAALAALFIGLAAALGWLDRARVSLRRHRIAYTYLAPAALGMAILVLAPFLIGCALGFYDHARGEWHYVGLKNFTTILGGDGRSLADPLNFWFTLAVTIIWTAVNVALHVVAGVLLALALRERWLRLRGVFRVLLILPWAVPNYITALIWRGMFQTQFGAVNALLHTLHLPGVAWFSHFATSFTANVVTNTWLGFPFMMVVALGALESIPRDLYEAAAVDGAGAWSRFVHITLPNLRPALGPAVILGSVWTFNMFNVIYLVSGGKPAGATDILVTQAYRWAFERGQRYGMAAAYATLIFVILLGWTLLGARAARAKQEAAA